MSEARDYNVLRWIKGELDSTVNDARLALEQVVDGDADDDQSAMGLCADRLHQVYGTLQMVQVYGAAMLAEEMELVARAMAAGSIGRPQDAAETLMLGLVKLPDYLEQIQAGAADVPLALLPLMNDLRAVRDAPLLSESALFGAELDKLLHEPEEKGEPDPELPALARQLRHRYHLGLLKVFRGEDGEDGMRLIGAVVRELEAAAGTTAVKRLLDAATGLIAAAEIGAVDTGTAVKHLLGKVDREIKRVIDQGEGAVAAAPATELFKSLLYYVAEAETDDPRVCRVKDRFELDRFWKTRSMPTLASGELSALNEDLLETVREAITQDITHIKDGLDLFIRGGSTDLERLSALAEPMDKVADTLGMVGQGALRVRLRQLAERVTATAAEGRTPSESELMDMAGEILFVESSLYNLGAADSGEGQGGATGVPEGEYRTLVRMTLSEAGAELAKAKEAVSSFLEHPNEFEIVAGVPARFRSTAGALKMIDLPEAAGMMDAIAGYFDREILPGNAPTAEAQEALADVVTSVEFFMDAVSHGDSGRGTILGVARDALGRLGLAAEELGLPEPGEGKSEPAAGPGEPLSAAPGGETSADPATATDAGAAEPGGQEADYSTAGLEPDRESEGWEEEGDEGPAASATVADETPLEGVDTEIVDIFLEEAREELEVIREKMPRWQADPSDVEALTTFRRSFHTLKGSGRLVGAAAIGEYAWSVENLLNRIIEGSVQPTPEIMSLLGRSMDVLPRLIASQETGEPHEVDVEDLMERGFELAGGRPAGPSAPPSTVPPPVAEQGLEQPATRDEPPSAEVVDLGELVSVGTAEDEADVSADAGASVEIELDPALAEIFGVESRAHLDTLRRFLESARSSPVAPELDDGVCRALHTLHGSAHMAEVNPVAALSASLERYANELRVLRQRADADFVDLLDRSTAAIETLVAAINMPGAEIPSWRPLVEEAEQARDLLEHAAAEEESFGEPTGLVMALDEDEGAAATDREGPVDEGPMADSASVSGGLAGVDVDSGQVDAEGPAPPEAFEVGQVAATELESATVEDTTGEQPGDSDDALVEPGASQADVAAADRPQDMEPAREDVAASDSVTAEGEPWAAEAAGAPLSEGDTDTTEETEAPAQEGSEIPAEVDAFEGEEGDRGAAEDMALLAGERTDTAEEVAVEQARADEAANGDSVETADFGEEPSEVDAGGAAADEGVDAGPDQPAEGDTASVLDGVEAEAQGPATREPDGSLEEAGAGVDEGLDTGLAQYGVPVETDEELLEVFLEEARELVEGMDRAMQEWTAEPASRAPLPGLERTLHTLKGGARLAGIAPVGDLSHNFESLLTSVDQERVAVDEYVIDLAQRVADRLVNQIDQVSEARRVRRADDLLEELEAAIAGRPVGIVGGPVEPIEAQPGEETPGTAAPAPEDASRVLQFPDRGLARPHAGPEEGRGIHAVTQAKSRPSALPRSSQEQVRVRAETLDRLVNNAGEVSIYRARLEQQNGALGFNLTELDQTVSRLRQQLRQLEIETEAQILFRYERDQEEAGVEYDQDFDPLEMDRFSTIQQLSRSLAETVNDLVSIRDIMDDLNRQTETLLLQQSRITTDLQDGLLRTRMVPFSTLVPRMHRLVRQTSGQLGKRAQLEVFGADSEMDRSILERMVAPLEHILRNAVSHGIESPEIRREQGKDEAGRVSIYLSREGNDVLLTVSDDGGGLRLDAIRGKAIERGLLAEGATVSDDDLIQFIMEHGFSTSDVVTQISGRGVGMDVVVSEVKQLGGAVEIDSQEGRGSSFTVRLPLTLAITDALLVELSEEVYAVPHTSIQGVVRASRQEIEDCYARRREGIEYAGHLYSVRYLGGLLDTGPLVLPEQTKWLPLLLVRAGEHRVALQVDALVGNRQIVVKSVGPQLSSVRWVTGGTILPDGRVALILDVNALVRMAAMQDISAAEQPTPEELGEGVTVMVVDDSITVRKVTSRLLERHNMNVLTAKDGVDAVAKLQEQVPDVMLLDIEMPRMDGYELARHMRNSPELAEVPIIMITSRTGEKHRTRAFELGVNRYLGKPYQETDLLENIYALLAEKQT